MSRLLSTCGCAALLVAAMLGFAQSIPQPGASAGGISELKSKAQAGDASAQYALGAAYEKGTGVEQNDDLAAQWYRKAAERGNAPGFRRCQAFVVGAFTRVALGSQTSRCDYV